MSTYAEISPNVPDTVPDYADSSYREGECVPNVPDIPPAFVSPEEAARAEAAAPSVPSAEDSASPPETASDFSSAASPSPWFRWYVAGTAFTAAALAAIIIGQTVSALALAAALPLWAQYALLIPLGFCCLVMLWVVLALARSWFRLRAVRQVDLDALEVLRARAETRQDGLAHFQKARAGLEKYLTHYPLGSDGCARLASAGIPPREIENLARSRDRLAAFAVDSRSWIAAFREEFQNTLDAAAHKRVSSWSLKAAGCVIASPLPLLDAVLVLTISLRMVKDLAAIYNVRSSRAGTFLLLNRAIVAAFVAGAAEDAAEVAGSMAAEELSGMIGESALNSVGAKVAGVVAPKLGEGAINAFFVRRLGKAVIRLLQPLRPQK